MSRGTYVWASRLVLIAVVVAGSLAGCGRGKPEVDLTADVQRRTSALTELARTGWTASASLSNGTAANAVDGSAVTSWNTGAAQASGQWFRVDMGSAQTFNEVLIDAGTTAGLFPAAYKLEVSNTGVDPDWTSVATGTGTSQAVSIRFVTTTSRYFRITQTGTKTNLNWAIAELRVYNGTQPCDTCTTAQACRVAKCDTMARASYSRDQLLGLWHLDGDGKDASDAANHFTSSASVTTVHGVDGAAFQFGAGAYLMQSNHPATDPWASPGFSFVAWVNPAVSCPGSWPLFQRGTQVGVQLSCAPGGTPGLSVALNLGSGFTYSAPVGSVPPNQWSLVAVTWDKSNARFYVNGAPVGSPLSRVGALSYGGAATYLGYYSGSSYLGVMDEAAYYGRALDQTEIAALVAGPTNLCQVQPTINDPCRDIGLVNGVCAATGPINEGGQCDDGKACTKNDICHAGACQGQLETCDDGVSVGVCEVKGCDPKFIKIPASDVIAQWHMDGDLVDASGRGNTMATTGTDTRAGRYGQGVHFAAASSCPSGNDTGNIAVNTPTGITFSTWVKPDAGFCPSTVNRVLFQRTNEFGVSLKCNADNTIGLAALLNTTGGWGWSNPVGKMNADQWSQVTVVYNKAQLVYYVNGAWVGGANSAAGDIWHQTPYYSLGCNAMATMDEATLYGRPLTGPEIASLYTSAKLCNIQPKVCSPSDSCHTTGVCDPVNGCPAPSALPQRSNGTACSDDNACTSGDTCNNGACGPGTPINPPCGPAPDQCKQAGTCDPAATAAPDPSGLVAWWRFEGDTKDSSGNGNDLTNAGAERSAGKLGSGFEFNGNSSCMSMLYSQPQLNMTGGTGMTIMAWVKPSTSPCAGQFGQILSRGADFGMATNCPATGSPGLTGLINYPGGSASGYGGVVGSVSNAAWNHVAITRSGTDMRTYVNGVLKAVNTLPSTALRAGDVTFNIGCYTDYVHATPWNWFKGNIDEVALYNRALTSAQITDYITRSNGNTCKFDDKPLGTGCDDGNACTTSDACNAGACVSGTPVTCTAQDQCHTAGTCNPSTGACSNPEADGAACNDGNACTQGDSCSSGSCGGTTVVCPVPDQCETGGGICDPTTGCLAIAPKAEGTPCDDGDACTTGDSCHGGRCRVGTAVTCTASGQCQVAGSCNPSTGACSTAVAAEGTHCDDGSACTQVDTCDAAGNCRGHSPVTCAALDGCHAAGVCDQATGTCSNPELPGGSCQSGPGEKINPTEGFDCSRATGVNSAGEIVGYSEPCSAPAWPATQPAQPFVTVDGITHALPNPENVTSAFATALSDGGYVAANTYALSEGNRPYLYRPISLDTPERLPFGPEGNALAISTPAFGSVFPTVVGEGATGVDANLWQWARYDVLPPGPIGSGTFYPQPEELTGAGAALGANVFGDIVGYYTLSQDLTTAMIVKGPRIEALATYLGEFSEGWWFDMATAINSTEQVVGVGEFNGFRRPFRLDIATGKVTDLLAIQTDAYRNLDLTPLAINDAGHIVGTAGYAVDAIGRQIDAQRAFVYTEASGTLDLNDVFEMPAGWVLTSAVGINNNDVVAAVATNPEQHRHVAFKVQLPDFSGSSCLGRIEDAACDDGNACTSGDHCHNGACKPGDLVTCVAQDQCHAAGTCDPQVGCSNPKLPNDTLCDDLSLCTQDDRCEEGRCAGKPTICTAQDQCHSPGICDPATGECPNPPAEEGRPCDDTSACTTGDTCRSGVCRGDDVTCTASDSCHSAGTCDAVTGICSSPVLPSCTETPLPGADFVASFDYGMKPHFVDLELPPPASSGICPTNQQACFDMNGSTGCQTVTFARENGALTAVLGTCVVPTCNKDDPERFVASCQVVPGITGVQHCGSDGHWGECKRIERCNGLKDDERNPDEAAKDPGGVCQLPVSIWDENHGRGFDTWLEATQTTAPDGSPIVEYRWKFERGGIVSAPPTPHSRRQRFTFPAVGTYLVTLTVTAQDGKIGMVQKPVEIRNYVIASMGDSMASGEGNPDKEAVGHKGGRPLSPEQPPQWQDYRCHRSLISFHAQAARKLEATDPHSSVSFTAAACSGAGMWSGLFHDYGGVEGDGILEESQLKATQRNVGGRNEGRQPLDALFLQIGANDAKFGDRVERCAYPSINIPSTPELTAITLTGIPWKCLDGDIYYCIPHPELIYLLGLTEALGEGDLTAKLCEEADEVATALGKLDRYECINAMIQGQPLSADCTDPMDPERFVFNKVEAGRVTTPATSADVTLNVAPEDIFIADYPDPLHYGASFTICPSLHLEGALKDGVIKMIPYPHSAGNKAAVFDALEILLALPLASLHPFIDLSNNDGVVSQHEAQWAYENVVIPLNQGVRAVGVKAPALGKDWAWTYVPGVNAPDKFPSHGYCAGPDTWFRHYDESKKFLWDYHGTLHPNLAGHGVYRDLLYGVVKERLDLRAKKPCDDRCPPSMCRTYYRDLDGDGYPSISMQACDESPVPPENWTSSTMGHDCCDNDPGAHPGATQFHTNKNLCDSYDWNCSNAEEQQFTGCPDIEHIDDPRPLACGEMCTGCTLVGCPKLTFPFQQACR